MMKSMNQTLITGCYRSGTEYITQLLNNHPNLASTMYTTNFMRYYFDKYNPIEKNYQRLISDASKRISERWGKNLNTDEILGYLKHQKEISYGIIYDVMMSNLFLDNTKTRWAEKTQLVWREIPDFLKMFPSGKAINIIRDPRSVLASFKKFTYAPEPAYFGAIFNCYDSMWYGDFYQDKFPNRFLQVKYEDVVLKPEKTLHDIFDFLGLSSDHDLLSENGWVDASGNNWDHNSAFTSNNEKFDKNAALSRWKNLYNWEISFCECINKEFMVKNHYGLSGIDADYISKIAKMGPDIHRYVKLWELGSGIQEFPTDPLKSENWEENR